MRAPVRLRRVAPVWAVATCAGAGVVVWLAQSHAQPRGPGRSVALAWTAPEECPDIDYVEGEIGRLLAGAPTPVVPLLRAHAEVKRSNVNEWRVVLETDGAEGGGRRTLAAESCRAAADATALILALAVDPERVATNQSVPAPSASPPPATSASTGVASNGAPSAAPSASPSPPLAREVGTPTPIRPNRPPPSNEARGRPTEISFALTAAVDFGTMPTFDIAGIATAGISPGLLPWLRLEVAGAIFKNDTSYVSYSGSIPSASFSLRAFDAGGCVDFVALMGFAASRRKIGACLDAELSWMVGSGQNELSNATRGATWLVWRPRGTLGYALSPHWALRADYSLGLASSDPPQFVDIGSGSDTLVHRPAKVTGRIAAGLEVRFW